MSEINNEELNIPEREPRKCPCCGGAAKVIYNYFNGDPVWKVKCTNEKLCGLQGGWFRVRNMALDAWDKRKGGGEQ